MNTITGSIAYTKDQTRVAYKDISNTYTVRIYSVVGIFILIYLFEIIIWAYQKFQK